MIEPLGELALRVEIPVGVDGRALLARASRLPGVVGAHLSEGHVCIVFEDEPPSIDAKLLSSDGADTPPPGRLHVVRVIYDGADLDEAAARAGLDREALIARHAERELVVSFVGFLPGFGYLRGLDAALASVPRLAAPRTRVEAGSVAIGGGYSGIYPFASPGGWQLLGRAVDWSPIEADHARFAAGDRVRFERAG